MPHNFIKINATTPNPGLRTRADVERIVAEHHGELDGFWFDDRHAPRSAWVLVRDGDVDGLMADLHGHQLIRLWLEGETNDPQSWLTGRPG